MKTKQEAKKEALAYLDQLSDEGRYCIRLVAQNNRFIVDTAGVSCKTFHFEPLIKDAPYQVWTGDTKPDKPCMCYYSGEGMEFYSFKGTCERQGTTRWEHCEKMKVGR